MSIDSGSSESRLPAPVQQVSATIRSQTIGRSLVMRLVLLATLLVSAPVNGQNCPGDCGRDGNVTVDELIRGVNIALDILPLAQCPQFDLNANGTVEINELIQAVNAALNGCPDAIEPIFPADYRDSFIEVRDCRTSIEHGVVAIRVLANRIAADAYLDEENPLPVGSILVKEEYDAPDCSDDADLDRWRVMRKEAPGFDPEHGDWRWQWVNADRSVRFNDKSTCIGCHRQPACVERDFMCTEDGPPPRRPLNLVAEHLPAALLSVAGPSASNIFAVGADPGDGMGPIILHYDGAALRRLVSGATGDLWWVSDPPISDALYFSGENGLVLRFDLSRRTFQRMDVPDDKVLFGIWGTDSNRIWAVGGDPRSEQTSGRIWFYDGTVWTLQDLAVVRPQGVPALFKVWGRGAREVYAVGAAGIVLRFDGNSWSEVTNPLKRKLFTVHGNTESVVGVGGSASGAIIELLGDEFVDRTPRGLPQMNGVFMPADWRGIAVGIEGAYAFRTVDGWRRKGTVFTEVPTDFHAAFIDNEGGLWAVGGDLSLNNLDEGVIAYGGERRIPAPSN